MVEFPSLDGANLLDRSNSHHRFPCPLLRQTRLAPLGGVQFGSPLLAPLFGAFGTFTADRLDETVKIVLAVVVGDFVAGLDVADRSQDHHAALAAARPRSKQYIRLGIGPAGVVGVARHIAAR